MENKFYIGYWLRGNEARQVYPMKAETIEQAKNELAENKEDLIFIGASGFSISDEHGVIIYRDNQ